MPPPGKRLVQSCKNDPWPGCIYSDKNKCYKNNNRFTNDDGTPKTCLIINLDEHRDCNFIYDQYEQGQPYNESQNTLKTCINYIASGNCPQGYSDYNVGYFINKNIIDNCFENDI